LATGSENGTVAFWDLRNTELPLYKERAHNKAVRRYLNLPSDIRDCF